MNPKTDTFGHHQGVRVEDKRFVTGHGRFLDDLRFADLAHMVVVRSPHAHADLVAIDIEEAQQMPGVLAVLTGRDLVADKIGAVPCVSKPRRADGVVQSIIEPPHLALATDRVVMVGQAIAIVVAETLDRALLASERVAVTYDERPVVVDPRQAVAAGAPTLWPEAPGNVSFTYELGDAEAVDRGLRNAVHVTDVLIDINRVAACPIEPRGAIGLYDTGTARFTLHVGHQTPHQMRHVLARSVFNVPESKMRIVSPDVGGGFGLKSGLFAEDVLVLWAARRLGRAVKWTSTRSEAFLSDDHARETYVRARLALDADHRFVGFRYDALANLGAYVALRGAHPPTNNLGSLSGLYRTQPIFARVQGVFTNTRPTSSYRGAGRPEATYVLERTIDHAASELGLDPADLRRRNLIAPAMMPYDTGLLFTYDCGDFPNQLEHAVKAAMSADFATRRQASAAKGCLRGFGLAGAIEQAGGPVGAPWEERAEIRFDLSGGATVLVGTMSAGQGHETVLARLVAERLGLARADVRVVQGDTDMAPFGRGTFGSRSLMAGGSAVVAACHKVIAQGRRLAALLLQAEAGSIVFADGRFTAPASGATVTIHDVIRAAFNVSALPDDLEGGLDQIATFAPPAPTYPSAFHCVEVEIDPETGVVTILRYAVVDDVGTVIDHAMVEAQVHGGIVQGFGQCIGEHVVYDAGGQLTGSSFLDYAMPRADDVPFFNVETKGVPTANNPLGVKGAGEAGTVGALPAIMNAIVDALAPLGIHHIDMPATPFRVWSAIQAARRDGPATKVVS